MKNKQKSLLNGLMFAFVLALPFALAADEVFTPAEAPEAEVQSEETQEIQMEIDARTNEEVSGKREQVLQRAAEALAETKAALKALDENNPDAALAALEKVTGKLALIVARNPELALAPVDVSVITYDLYASPETVKEQVKTAQQMLKDGNVQAAREALKFLASEIRIRTSHIPLATYPSAIAAVAPLIDEGKVEEAKTALQAALNTLVVTENIMPLPIIRAVALLESAEKIAETEGRTDEQNQNLTDMLEAARTQVKLARILGYGDKSDIEPILDELALIEKKTNAGKSGSGFFDRIKKRIDDL